MIFNVEMVNSPLSFSYNWSNLLLNDKVLEMTTYFGPVEMFPETFEICSGFVIVFLNIGVLPQIETKNWYQLATVILVDYVHQCVVLIVSLFDHKLSFSRITKPDPTWLES